MLEERVESAANGGGGNKEGTERARRGEMKGCVGGRDVGEQQRNEKKKNGGFTTLDPLAPQMFVIKTSFHSHSHTPLLTFA